MDFDNTFDQQYPDLVRYCHRLTGDRDVAEDVAQESLLRLFDRGIEGSEHGVRAWLFKTATHLVRDRYRVRQNRKRLLEVNPVVPSAAEAPDTSLERSEDRNRVREALDTLAPRDREMLLMRYSGFSYREIADVIGVNATSVGTLLSRAEKRFERAMTEAGEAA